MLRTIVLSKQTKQKFAIMNNIYEIIGDKFDFEIKPTEQGIKDANLWWLPDFTIKCVNGIIYLLSDKKFGIGKGIRVKKHDFYYHVFNMFYEPTDNDIRKMSINDIRVALNAYPSAIRQLYLDFANLKRVPECE